MKVVLLAGLLTLAASPAHALTAVCKDPTGHIFGVHGKALKGKPFDERDGMNGGLFTVIWHHGEKEAQIISQGAGGGAPETERALLVFESKDQITFLALYSSAVWLYSLYPGPKLLMLTSHNNGVSVDVGGAVTKSFQAHCDVSES